MEKKHIVFPNAWSHFLTAKEREWLEEYDHHFYVQFPLLYDAAYIQGLHTLQPWNIRDETVPIVFTEWERIKEELHEKFSNRKQLFVEELMKQGIGLFLEALYWSNRCPVDPNNVEGDQLNIKPVNLQERLDFIFTYPNKYHSYVQLSELFVEMEKLFIKQQVMNKIQ